MLRLTKLHGLGNDFLVMLDPALGRTGTIAGPAPLIERQDELARTLCDRRRGIGADGLLVALAPDASQAEGGIDAVMVLHNADGSRAEMSGNGIRCLGHALVLAGVGAGTVGDGSDDATTPTSPGAVLRLLTDAGPRTVQVDLRPGAGRAEVEVAMGRIGDRSALTGTALELVGDRRHAVLDVGNPHLVVEVDDPTAVDLEREGSALERAVPGGVNVEFVAADGDGIRLVVWERGVGVTEACGTGACAAASAALRWGLAVTNPVSVRMPGGSVTVSVGSTGAEQPDGGQVVLTGPSEVIATVEVDAGLLARGAS
jgi:diaminopimelate epimerase